MDHAILKLLDEIFEDPKYELVVFRINGVYVCFL